MTFHFIELSSFYVYNHLKESQVISIGSEWNLRNLKNFSIRTLGPSSFDAFSKILFSCLRSQAEQNSFLKISSEAGKTWLVVVKVWQKTHKIQCSGGNLVQPIFGCMSVCWTDIKWYSSSSLMVKFGSTNKLLEFIHSFIEIINFTRRIQ